MQLKSKSLEMSSMHKYLAIIFRYKITSILAKRESFAKFDKTFLFRTVVKVKRNEAFKCLKTHYNQIIDDIWP